MGKKKQKADLIDETESPDDVLKVESTIYLELLQLKDKKWSARFLIGAILPKSYHRYKITLTLNEDPYLERIEELEKGLDESLFREEQGSIKDVNKRIGQIRAELERMQKDCPEIEFNATVEEIKYKDAETRLTCRIPDDIIEPINKQKYRLEAYKIVLIPLYT